MKVKVCGLKNAVNMADVDALQPDYVGFIFYEGSQRNMELSKIPKQVTAKKVGVFVDAPLSFIAQKQQAFQLDVVQLHGSETAAFATEVQALGVQVVKAFNVDDAFEFDTLKAYNTCCDAFLLDAKGRLPGGNGAQFNWTKLSEYSLQKPFFLSGGIGPQHADQIMALKKLYPNMMGVDLNSGFETAPGHKNVDHLKTFIQKIKSHGSNCG